MLITNFFIVLFLILLNGFFAMSEIAVVSSRPARLKNMAKSGSRGASRAVKLKEDSTSFLSTVQIGITLVGIFAGAFGASAFAPLLADVLQPVLGSYADTVSFALVVVAITYFSLVVGELVPKRFALTRAEAIASTVAPFMHLLSKAAAPVVWLLRVSTEGALRIFGGAGETDEGVSEEEVKAMIAEGTQTGVFEPKEREMIEAVLRIADRTVRSIMTPRTETDWLSVEDTPEMILDEIRVSDHSRFPVSGADVDDVKGFVRTKDLLEQFRRDKTIDLEKAVQDVLFVSEAMPVLKLLERFRTGGVHMAVVVDEYGSFQGVVTPTDVLTAIGGSLPEGREEEPGAIQRGDGSWLLDGGLPVDQVEIVLETIRFSEDRHYETLAGFVLEELGHLPIVGEEFTWSGWRFEVMDLDGRRIDKILAHPASSAPSREAEPVGE